MMVGAQAYPFGHEPILEAGKILQAAQEGSMGEVQQMESEPQRPKVPSRFSADIKIISFSAGFLAFDVGLYARDAAQKASRLEDLRDFPLLKSLKTNLTNLILVDKAYTITGGSDPICRQLPMFGAQKFVDLFGWASNPQLSEYVGERTVAGRGCSLWRLRSNTSMSLCADGDQPVELNITLSISGIPASNTSYQFGSLTLGDQVPPSLLEKPMICNEVAPPCESGRGKAADLLDAYVFHPGMSAIDYNIEDQNIADLIGDAFFICGDKLNNASKATIDHNYTLISRYTLEISSAFGQYGVCNGYPDTTPPGPVCFGGDLRLVGKEAPFFAGDGESRCAAESKAGFWYSLPKAGHCPAGQSPSTTAASTGCSWSIQKRLKTIQQSCLMETHGYLDLCKKDFVEKTGFANSIAALRAAFASENLASGGCPDVGGPSDGDFAVVVWSKVTTTCGRFLYTATLPAQ